MRNLVNGIRLSGADPEDVIVVLDGDDWLSTDRALRIIANAYDGSDCWMTYGSWTSNMMGENRRYGGMWPPYPPETTDFRRTRWLGTAVRTWKRWLWDLIDDRDFRDAAGNYFRVTEDQAAMLPMLEMSGTERARHIPDVLMVYNRSSPHACGLTCCGEMLANGEYLRTRAPYSRLRQKPALLNTQQCCIS